MRRRHRNSVGVPAKAPRDALHFLFIFDSRERRKTTDRALKCETLAIVESRAPRDSAKSAIPEPAQRFA